MKKKYSPKITKEEAKADARELMSSDYPDRIKVRETNEALRYHLDDLDIFWVRWASFRSKIIGE